MVSVATAPKQLSCIERIEHSLQASTLPAYSNMATTLMDLDDASDTPSGWLGASRQEALWEHGLVQALAKVPTEDLLLIVYADHGMLSHTYV